VGRGQADEPGGSVTLVPNAACEVPALPEATGEHHPLKGDAGGPSRGQTGAHTRQPAS